MEIVRKYYGAYTLGYLFVKTSESNEYITNGILLRTLEPPWKNNERNVSCIPEGKYKFQRYRSGKFKQAFKVYQELKTYERDGTPFARCTGTLFHDHSSRSDILIHSGNFLENTQGCILVGLKAELSSNGMPNLTESRVAIGDLLYIFDDDGRYYDLTIRKEEEDN
jgi:hypothetical protein